jgi:hypothetical protein
MRILAVCPQRVFVEDTIDTQEFWKRKKASDVFDIMEDATTELLYSEDFDPTNEQIVIYEINEYKGRLPNRNF